MPVREADDPPIEIRDHPCMPASGTVTGPHLGVHPETGLRAFIAFNGARKRKGDWNRFAEQFRR